MDSRSQARTDIGALRSKTSRAVNYSMDLQLMAEGPILEEQIGVAARE